MVDATIQVKHLNGSNYAIPISLDATIGSLKEKVLEASEIAAARQRIIFKGAEVQNHVQMRAAGLTDGAVVHLVERLITPAEPGTPPGAATRPEQNAPPPLAAATMGGGGLEVVNTLVQQMIGGLLGQGSPGTGSPLSPGSPQGSRVVLRQLNGLEAVHGFLNAIGELDDVDDPPALLPIARSGVPLFQSGYQSVTQATTAIIREHERDHGSLQDALSAATNSQSLDAATVEQISALFTRVDEAHTAFRASAATAANVGSVAATTAAAPAPVDPPAAVASPLGQAAAPGAEMPPVDASSGPGGSQHVQEQLQLAMLANALTMARSAQCMQRFTDSMSNRAQQLAREVVREIAAGEQTFPASQVVMEQLGTAANRASGLTLESAYLCSLFTQAVRGDHSLLPDGMRPVVLQRDSQNRPTSSGATAAAETGPGPTDSATTAAAAAAPTVPVSAPLRSISINPGYAPMMVSQGSGGVGNRLRMQGIRSVNGGQMEMFMSPGTDPAAGGIIEEMLASGIVPTAQAPGTRAAQPGMPAPGAAAVGSVPAAVSGSDAANPATSAPAALPPIQPLSGLPIFHGDGAQHATGMAAPGIHVSSSVVTGGLPFGNNRGSMDMPDGTMDVGGMIIQVELPPEGSTSTPNVHTTGIGQLGSVLQNMMQEQLAAARMSQGRSSPVARQGAPGTDLPSESALPGGGPGQLPAQAGLPQRVLQLTQQLVADISRQQNLPEAERSAEGARMAQSYLRQVPELLRQALPGIAAGVDSFMAEVRGGAAGSAFPTTQAGTANDPPQASPAAPTAAPTGATPAPVVPLASAPVSSTAGPAAHALDLDSEDHSQTLPEEPTPPPVLSGATATTAVPRSAAAAASTSAAGPSGGTASESTRADRPEPKGLARGLKPRKPKGLGLGTGTRTAAPSATDRSGSTTRSSAAGAAAAGTTGIGATDAAGGGALPGMGGLGGSMGAGAPGAGGAPPGLEALLGGLGGAGGAGGGGLMDMVSNMAQNPNMQRMMQSPQMQDVANQMESGNTDFGSLLQQMMPMVGSMFGGGAGDAGGMPGMPMPAGPGAAGGGAASAGARSTGAGAGLAAASAAGGSSAGGPPDVEAFRGMLGEVVGEGEADGWMRQIIQDRGMLRQQGAATAEREHSEVYSAGSVPEEAGKGVFGV